MKVFELRKRADKSGPAPAEGESWPLARVEFSGDLPETWEFSEDFVKQGVAEGWISYAGAPLSYVLNGDPLGEFAVFATQEARLPGDRLVLDLFNGGEVTATYRITRGPCPRGFRHEDGTTNHTFQISLESVNG